MPMVTPLMPPGHVGLTEFFSYRWRAPTSKLTMSSRLAHEHSRLARVIADIDFEPPFEGRQRLRPEYAIRPDTDFLLDPAQPASSCSRGVGMRRQATRAAWNGQYGAAGLRSLAALPSGPGRREIETGCERGTFVVLQLLEQRGRPRGQLAEEVFPFVPKLTARDGERFDPVIALPCCARNCSRAPSPRRESRRDRH
jgi:hypothetical protein